MKYLSISLITPSYNQGRFIERTIQSVISQNYPRLEYFILDSLSTDKTKDILYKYRKFCKIIIKKDKGQANAINNGLRLSNGEIVGYLNSDDLLAPNSLFEINNFFQKNQSANIATGKCLIIDEENKEARKYLTIVRKIIPSSVRFKFPIINIINLIAQPSTFWRKKIISEVGLLNEHYNLAFDYEYFLRISQKYPIFFLPKVLSYFRVHKAQKSKRHTLHFEEDYQVACLYTKNHFVKFLSFLSRKLIIVTYKLIEIFHL